MSDSPSVNNGTRFDAATNRARVPLQSQIGPQEPVPNVQSPLHYRWIERQQQPATEVLMKANLSILATHPLVGGGSPTACTIQSRANDLCPMFTISLSFVCAAAAGRQVTTRTGGRASGSEVPRGPVFRCAIFRHFFEFRRRSFAGTPNDLSSPPASKHTFCTHCTCVCIQVVSATRGNFGDQLVLVRPFDFWRGLLLRVTV